MIQNGTKFKLRGSEKTRPTIAVIGIALSEAVHYPTDDTTLWEDIRLTLDTTLAEHATVQISTTPPGTNPFARNTTENRDR
jgi:hypothetical protein